MRNVERILCLFVLLGACGTMMLASDDDIGPIFNSPSQTVFCMVYCDGGGASDGSCEFTLQIQGPEGNVLKSKEFSNVPTNGIRKITYAGIKNPISCETVATNASGQVSEPSWTVVDNRGNVVAMGTNDDDESSEDVGPVWNARNQTPVCLVHCNSDPCDFRIEITASNGQVIMEKTFWNVPAEGNRMLAYGGGQKMIACEAHEIGTGECVGYPSEPAWSILDVKGNVVAYMTNDAD